jgi:metal transporter CNNM
MPSGITFYIFIFGIPILVLLNGLIAGLTLGLLSLDETRLTVLNNSGTPSQKRAAARIKPLRSNTHLLLATLLLGNTVINEALPILLQNVVSNEWISIGISVVLVLTFAELIPQALCCRYGLQIGSKFAWFVYILRAIVYPIAWPIAKTLDFFLGKQEGALYKKSELKEFVTLHGQVYGGDLTPDEVKIMQGTLSLHMKTVDQVMTRLLNVFMLESETLLDENIIQSIADAGHSRIPIYEREKDNILGIMLVKNLILLDDTVDTYIRDLDLINAPRMKTDTNLFDAINFFQEGASHMAIVVSNENHVIGICTLEDCIEEILLEEVFDESDTYTDNTHTTKIIRKARSERKQYIVK